jgi:hypothetical protein
MVEDRQGAAAQMLRGLRAERRLLEQLLRLEVVRAEAGGIDAVRDHLLEQGRTPMDIDAVLEYFGVDSVGERLVDLRSDIDMLESMLGEG